MIVIYLSVKNGDGINISRRILERKYAISIDIKKVETLYLEKDNIKEEDRELLIIKTREELFDKIEELIKEIYKNNIIEMYSINVDDANKDFLDLLEKETSIKKIKNA
ncbi:divalent cation tolerance protein CutA [Candidatus Nanobsidianus stetteri]|jgi:periplasmic divalent cation tolerance protein|uniref:Divalent cation tolerance protein CutA n=1 Tax=Nanobsidianus stetteri TaxID=1294122 RepID=A0A2T9WL40_NANST|nr:divalent cation tolerance protein CutA [Candidatus Nanobsidianus stetteri]MCC5447272.1 divalent cation tolerance protein CutA [Candidatus Nanobsidianus stetteri]